MNVSDLAAELEVPASRILDQCRRFGIDATWAGAELSGTDVVVIRSELASDAPLDLTPADADTPDAPEAELVAADAVVAAPVAPEPVADGARSTALPPTAVGSLPGIVGDVTPAADAGERAPGFTLAGSEQGGAVDPQANRTIPRREPPASRRLERAARNAVIALVVGVVAFALSNFIDVPAVVAVLWFITALALAVAVVDGIRGRRHVQTHPERLRGVWMASLTVVLAIGGIIGLTASVVTAVGDAPAADGPAGISDLSSVQTARWGYQRVRRIADDGWHQPARLEGSCWIVDANSRDKVRDVDDRVELAKVAEHVDCDANHTLEVAKVFAVDRDADSPYPQTEGLIRIAQEKCGAMFERISAKEAEVELKIEYPTDIGWRAADHDVACVLVTPKRTGALAG